VSNPEPERGGVELAASTPGEDAPPAPGPPEAERPARLPYAVIFVVTVAVVALLGLLVWGIARKQGSFGGFAVNTVGQVGQLRPGPARDFQIRLFSGGDFRLSEQRGKAVLVNFWASWCPPCREEAPVLERAWRRYRDRGVVLVGVDIWDSEQDAREFLRQFGVTYPNGPDPNGSVAVDYGLTGIPETFFVRPDGTVARRWIGPLTDEQISAFIEDIAR
jgi:cytochrome c biogenesis protein CcmG/thiol:disulfide interchange protein DsbE